MGLYRAIRDTLRARHRLPEVARAIEDGERFIEEVTRGACGPKVPLVSPYQGPKVEAGTGKWSQVYALANPVLIGRERRERLVERVTGYPRRGFTPDEDKATLVTPLWASRDKTLVDAGLVPTQAYAFRGGEGRSRMRLCTYMERFDMTLQDSRFSTEQERIAHAPDTMRRFAAATRLVARINDAGYLIGDISPENILFKEREGQLVAGLSDTDGLYRVRSQVSRKLQDDADRINPPVAMMATLDYAAEDQLKGKGLTPWTDMESLGIVGAHLAGFRHGGTASSRYMLHLDPAPMLDERNAYIEGGQLRDDARRLGYEGLADVVGKMVAGDYLKVSQAADDLDALVSAGRQ